MKPDRFEWLNQERARIAREGTGKKFVQYQMRRHLLRTAGISGAMLLAVLFLAKLPTQPDGRLEPFAVLGFGLAVVATGIVALRAGASGHLLGWWASRTAIGFGALLVVASALI